MKYKDIIKFVFSLLFMSGYAQIIDFETSETKKFNLNAFKVSIHPLETSNKFLIGKPSQVVFFEKKWYVLDYLSKKIFIFNKNGTFSNEINGLGEGPEKYSNISYFTINPFTKNIELVDPSTSKIYKFNINGNYISSIKTTYFLDSFLYLDLNTIVIDKAYQRGDDKDFNLLLVDKDFIIKKQISEITKQPPSALSFASRFSLKKINSKISWTKTYDPTLYEISSKGIENKIHIKYDNIWPEEKFAFNDKLTDLNLIYQTFIKKYMYFFDIYSFKSNYISKYTYQKIPYISILNKKTNKSTTYNCSKMPKNFNDFIGYTDSSVIIMMNPDDIIKAKIPLTKEQLNLIDSYENEPNPWIITLEKK